MVVSILNPTRRVSPNRREPGFERAWKHAHRYGSETGQVTGTRRISEGATSDLILADSSGQCLLPADVEGDVATVTPGASCTQILNNVTVTRTITSGTASISGKVVQVHLTGNLTATSQGMSYPGSFSENITLTRVAK